jgi:hypothetical protein
VPTDPTTPPVTCPLCNKLMLPWRPRDAADAVLRCTSCGAKCPLGWTGDVPPPAPRRDGNAMPAGGEVTPLSEDIPCDYGEVAYRFAPDETDQMTPHNGLADEYVVMRTPAAISGVIVFAKYRGTWEANVSERAVIRRLLSERDALAKRCAVERWVPAGERMPPKGEMVLAWGEEAGTVFVDKFDGQRWVSRFRYTHWKPLPQPPAESAAQKGIKLP